MLDRKRSDVGIMDEIGTHRGIGQEPGEDLGVPIARLRDPCILAAQPLGYLLPSLGDGLGLFEDARIGDDAQEAQQARPGKSHRSRAAELRIEPGPRGRVLPE